jgi:hypothetical protein
MKRIESVKSFNHQYDVISSSDSDDGTFGSVNPTLICLHKY